MQTQVPWATSVAVGNSTSMSFSSTMNEKTKLAAFIREDSEQGFMTIAG